MLSIIGIIVCILVLVMLWVPMCSSGPEWVTPIDCLGSYIEDPDPVPSIAHTHATAIPPPKPTPTPEPKWHNYLDDSPYAIRTADGLGVGVKLENGTVIHRYWPLKLDPGTFNSEPYAIKHSGGVGVGITLKDGTVIQKFWYHNGRHREDRWAPPISTRKSRASMRYVARPMVIPVHGGIG